MKSNIRRSPLLTLAFSLICPTLTAAAQTSLRREVGARRRLPSVSRLRNLVPEVLQPAEQMFCYRCGRPVSPRSQRTVTAQRWPEADLNSPASPFHHDLGIYPPKSPLYVVTRIMSPQRRLCGGGRGIRTFGSLFVVNGPSPCSNRGDSPAGGTVCPG